MSDDDLGQAGRPLRSTPFRFGLLAGFGALLAIFVAGLVGRAAGILTMLITAGFITIGLNRLVTRLTARGMKHGKAVLVVVLSLAVLGLGAFALIVPNLVKQASEFFAALPGYLQEWTDRGAAAGSGIDETLAHSITPQNVASIAGGLLGGVASLAGALFWGLTMVLVSLFLLASWDRVVSGAYRFVPASRRVRVRRLGDAMLDKVGAYLVGAVTVAMFASTAALLWCLFMKIPYPLLLALVVGFCDMIPQVGATIGSIVVILVALTVSLPLAVATIIFFCAYQGMENWIVYPRMMSRAVKISNLAAIVSALVGGALLGILGVLIAVPLYASVQLLVREVVFPRQEQL